MDKDFEFGRTLLEFREYNGERYIVGEATPEMLIELSVFGLMEACDYLNQEAENPISHSDFAKMVVKHYMDK